MTRVLKTDTSNWATVGVSRVVQRWTPRPPEPTLPSNSALHRLGQSVGVLSSTQSGVGRGNAMFAQQGGGGGWHWLRGDPHPFVASIILAAVFSSRSRSSGFLSPTLGQTRIFCIVEDVPPVPAYRSFACFLLHIASRTQQVASFHLPVPGHSVSEGSDLRALRPPDEACA